MTRRMRAHARRHADRHARVHVARAGARQRRRSRAADIYALGVIAFEMLTGAAAVHRGQRDGADRRAHAAAAAAAVDDRAGHAARARSARARRCSRRIRHRRPTLHADDGECSRTSATTRAPSGAPTTPQADAAIIAAAARRERLDDSVTSSGEQMLTARAVSRRARASGSTGIAAVGVLGAAGIGDRRHARAKAAIRRAAAPPEPPPCRTPTAPIERRRRRTAGCGVVVAAPVDAAVEVSGDAGRCAAKPSTRDRRSRHRRRNQRSRRENRPSTGRDIRHLMMTTMVSSASPRRRMT